MIRQIAIIALALCSLFGTAAAQEFIPLWESGKMPNSKGMAVKDDIRNERIYQVGTPGFYAFFPSQQENKGAAVLICPGGGYERLAYMISGTQLAKWFNTLGVSAFVLNYRLPVSPDLKQRESGPLEDAQRAMRVIRANADKWHIKTDKIGVLGTSAGGHLAAVLGTLTNDFAKAGDDLDKLPFAPNFMILVSPVISMGEYAHPTSKKNLLGPNPSDELTDKYSAEKQVTAATPPAFIALAADDHVVNPHNSLLFYTAMLDKHVSASLHIFPHGGHSIALRNNPGSTRSWTDLCEMWLVEMGFIAEIKAGSAITAGQRQTARASSKRDGIRQLDSVRAQDQRTLIQSRNRSFSHLCSFLVGHIEVRSEKKNGPAIRKAISQID